MGIQVLSLEQVCRESVHEPTDLALDIARQVVSAEVTERKFHTVLQHLVNTLTLPDSLDEMLHALATLTQQAMVSDLCVIMLRDQANEELRTCICTPDLSDKGVIVQPVHVEAVLWERLHNFTLRGQLPVLPAHEVARLNPLKNVQYKTLFPLPLFVGSECIGLLNCYSSKSQQYSHDDQLLLTMIASQAALAIKHRQSVEKDALAQKNYVHAFVDDLLSGRSEIEGSLQRRSYFPGYDLSKPHAVALIELSEMENLHPASQIARTPPEQHGVFSKEERLARYEAAIQQVQQSIQESYPGSLVDERENILICLLCLDQKPEVSQANSWLNQLVSRIQRERHVRMLAGVGNLCQAIRDYQRGYAEASEALDLGQTLAVERCSTHFDELGAYRYIYKFARTDTLCDQYQERVVAIADYDRRKKTMLLETLETYLECGGNAARTSSQLDIHRNTLLQRLERLQKICTFDLEQLQHRLPLLLALKVHRLRVCELAGGPE